jgi:hypothetical protein
MSKDSGYKVKTKSGKEGRTYHRESKVNGKIVVHVEGEAETQTKLLCNPESIEIIGFID